jgi:hypothetical protein
VEVGKTRFHPWNRVTVGVAQASAIYACNGTFSERTLSAAVWMYCTCPKTTSARGTRAGGAIVSECAKSLAVGQRRRNARRTCRTGHVRSSDFGARHRRNGTCNTPAISIYGSGLEPLVLGRLPKCCVAG